MEADNSALKAYHPDRGTPIAGIRHYAAFSLIFLYFLKNQQVTLLFGVFYFDFYFFIFLIFSHLCVVL